MTTYVSNNICGREQDKMTVFQAGIVILSSTELPRKFDAEMLQITLSGSYPETPPEAVYIVFI